MTKIGIYFSGVYNSASARIKSVLWGGGKYPPVIHLIANRIVIKAELPPEQAFLANDRSLKLMIAAQLRDHAAYSPAGPIEIESLLQVKTRTITDIRTEEWGNQENYSDQVWIKSTDKTVEVSGFVYKRNGGAYREKTEFYFPQKYLITLSSNWEKVG